MTHSVYEHYTIRFGDNELTLLPDHAVWWPDYRALILSDVHLGKTGHFRRNGLPIPGTSSMDELSRIRLLADYHEAEHVLILGDFFHSEINSEWFLTRSWHQFARDTQIQLVPGNHDTLDQGTYREAGIEVVQAAHGIGTLTFVHDREEALRQKLITEQDSVISGHVHPVIRLQGNGRQRLRFPCFLHRRDHLLLPSFGFFTGGHAIGAERDDQIYAVIDRKELYHVPVSS